MIRINCIVVLLYDKLIILFLYVSDSFAYYYELLYDPDHEFGLPYILERVECTSNELHLSQCNYIEYNYNYFSLHVIFAVKCQITRQSKLSDTYSYIALHRWLQARAYQGLVWVDIAWCMLIENMA